MFAELGGKKCVTANNEKSICEMIILDRLKEIFIRATGQSERHS